MKSGERARVPAGVRRGPSRVLIVAVVAPVLALLAGLILWAFSVRDWTWFSLLIAAAIGVSAFVVAPDMFSISNSTAPEEWCLTKPPSHRPDTLKRRAGADAAGDRDSHAPNRSA